MEPLFTNAPRMQFSVHSSRECTAEALFPVIYRRKLELNCLLVCTSATTHRAWSWNLAHW